jgi:hypothetical protein
MKIILQAHPPDLSQRQQGPTHFFFSNWQKNVDNCGRTLVNKELAARDHSCNSLALTLLGRDLFG